MKQAEIERVVIRPRDAMGSRGVLMPPEGTRGLTGERAVTIVSVHGRTFWVDQAQLDSRVSAVDLKTWAEVTLDFVGKK